MGGSGVGKPTAAWTKWRRVLWFGGGLVVAIRPGGTTGGKTETLEKTKTFPKAWGMED